MVNNEMNLLPQGMKGFANTIRCFFGECINKQLIIVQIILLAAEALVDCISLASPVVV